MGIPALDSTAFDVSALDAPVLPLESNPNASQLFAWLLLGQHSSLLDPYQSIFPQFFLAMRYRSQLSRLILIFAHIVQSSAEDGLDLLVP